MLRSFVTEMCEGQTKTGQEKFRSEVGKLGAISCAQVRGGRNASTARERRYPCSLFAQHDTGALEDLLSTCNLHRDGLRKAED
jgi:hypothetical protein